MNAWWAAYAVESGAWIAVLILWGHVVAKAIEIAERSDPWR